MSEQAIVKQEPNAPSASIVERVMLAGDLSKLSPADRVAYYVQTCKSLGLNPLTRPFEYITLNGKLTLYARKDATDQLRKLNGVSIGKPDIQQIDDLIIVTVVATDRGGRTDADLGVVKKSDMRGDLANAMMKAVTKAKRRVTLSICGLGMLDETEVETIPDARPVTVSDAGVIVEPPTQAAHDEPASDIAERFAAWKVLPNAELIAHRAEIIDLYKRVKKVGEANGMGETVRKFPAMSDMSAKQLLDVTMALYAALTAQPQVQAA